MSQTYNTRWIRGSPTNKTTTHRFFRFEAAKTRNLVRGFHIADSQLNITKNRDQARRGNAADRRALDITTLRASHTRIPTLIFVEEVSLATVAIVRDTITRKIIISDWYSPT